MTFDTSISVGAVVEIVVFLAGLGGGWATLKVMQKITLDKLKDLQADSDADRKRNDARHDDNQERMRTIELKIANECLKKDDFREFERRLNDKIDKIEHTVGNAASKAAGLIGDMLRARDLLPRSGRE